MLINFVIVPHKKETLTSFIESLKNGPENYGSIYEGSFIFATTVNILGDLGWRRELSIASGMNNRAIELVFL